MQRSGTAGNTATVIAEFVKHSRDIQHKFGDHPDLSAAVAIYKQLVEVQRKLVMVEDWLKTDPTDINP